MPEPLELEPNSFVAGDSVSWTKALTDYPAGEGWVLTYEFRGTTRKTVACGADGDDHLATITAAVSATFNPGTYFVFAFVTKLTERFSVWKGEIKVEPNPALGNSAYDGRSHARKCLDAIEAALEGRMGREEASYSINFGGVNRQLNLCSHADLINAHSHYSALVRAEQQAARVTQGRKSGNRVLVNFTR